MRIVRFQSGGQIYQGHDVDAMMERAGRAVADTVLRRYPDARRIAAACGKGANGGDGRIALRLLAEAGRETGEELDGADVVIDALFGTGFHGAPRDEAAQTIERINASDAPVVAVDLPSGVDASTGEIAGAVVDADVTVTMHAQKVGLVVGPGRFHAGEVEIADIGLEHAQTTHRLVTEEVLSEYKGVLTRLGVRRNLVGQIINLLREEAEFVDVREESDISPDPSDNAICACAEQGGAAFIVTLNRKDFPQKNLVAKVISPGDAFPTTRRGPR